MATVGTSTQTNPLTPPNGAALARDFSSGTSNGYLWCVALTAANQLTAFRSTNDGGSWSSVASFTHTGLQEWSSLVIDKGGRDAHLMYRLDSAGQDGVYYRRLDLDAGVWGGGVLMSGTFNNSGVPGSRIQGMDLAVHRRSSSLTWIVHAFGFSDGSGKYGIALGAVSLTVSTGGVSNAAGTVISGAHYYMHSTASGRVGPTVELEHTGDGISPSSTPNVWITYGRYAVNAVKLAWNGNGWTAPAGSQQVKATIGGADYIPARWDGTRFVMAVINPDDTTKALVLQRNQSNTSTTTLPATPTHPTGVIRQLAVSYDHATKDVRVYAVGTSTDVLYFVTYSRAGGTWGAWATVTATAVLSSGTEFSVRKGGTAGNTRFDVVTAHSGAPNTIVHTAQATNTVPANPSWDTSSVPYVNGGAADINAGLTLDWIFSDPDPGQTQQSYALSRQIGAGAVQYYTAAGGTWGGSEVQNVTSTSLVTLASGWGADADANHSYRVRVWDSSGTPSAGYGPAMVLTPSVKVNPAITAPAAAAVLNTDTVTVTWTAAQQKTRRVRLLTNPGGVVAYDSGFVTTADLSFAVPYRLDNGTGWTVELTTTNNEGLASTPQTRNFTVSYANAAVPTSTLTPLAALGVVRVTAVQSAAVGVQPATAALDLYRRVSPGAPLNANDHFEGNVTGWIVGGGGTPGTLTYSTTQQFPGYGTPYGSARYVPPASGAADPGVESSAYTPITAGRRYVATALIRPDTSNKPVKVRIMWYTAANALVGTTESSATAIAGAWQYLEVEGDPAGFPTATKMRVSAGAGNTPAAADAWYVAQATIREQTADPIGTRVAVTQSPGAVVDDWGAASNVDYEYRWLAYGVNGASYYGPWVR